MKFYKANSKSSGSACSFSLTTTGKGQGIYVQIVKQTSWNESTKTGSFDKNQDNKIHVKFSLAEVAAMMEVCQRRKGKKSFVHKTDAGTSSISFGVYPDEGEARGLSLGVFKNDKRASIPLSFDEGLALLEWFRFAIHRIFAADYAAEKKLFENKES
jgi:hypothetical protein